jgi:hypothetical protein
MRAPASLTFAFTLAPALAFAFAFVCGCGGSEELSFDAAVDATMDLACGHGTPGEVDCPSAGTCAKNSCVVCSGTATMIGDGHCVNTDAGGGGTGTCYLFACDGREDCGPGEYCANTNAGSVCALGTGPADQVVCHTSCDCPPEKPVCKMDRLCHTM